MQTPSSHILKLAKLSGRTVLITGASGHLGQAIAETMAEAGAQVALSDRSLDSLVSIADHLSETTGATVSAHGCDLADEAAVRRLPEIVAERHGGTAPRRSSAFPRIRK